MNAILLESDTPQALSQKLIRAIIIKEYRQDTLGSRLSNWHNQEGAKSFNHHVNQSMFHFMCAHFNELSKSSL